MSRPLKKYNANYYSKYGMLQETDHSYYDYIEQPIQKRRKVPKNKANASLFRKIIDTIFTTLFLGAFVYYTCPYNFEHFFRPLFLNGFVNRNLKIDSNKYLFPTRKYLNNAQILDRQLFVDASPKSKEIGNIKIITELSDTKAKLQNLFANYPKLEPSVFVWEYSTGSGLEINSDAVYPSASIIKIPIVFELIRLIDSTSKNLNPINLTDRRIFSEEFRTLGSGNLQYTKANTAYTLDYLANISIANSDNSATNMLLYEIGGIEGFNRTMRNLGLKTTRIDEWLPDLDGNNKITAREISTLLYNIDNPSYINPKYKNILKEYLGNTRNTHLLKEKLPIDSMVLHKTGDIGTMLGDSGIIYTNNGKKYIVTILVKRPFNHYGAKTLIQDASLLIYEDIKKLP